MTEKFINDVDILRQELSSWLTHVLDMGYDEDNLEADLLMLRDWVDTGALGEAPAPARLDDPKPIPEEVVAMYRKAYIVETPTFIWIRGQKFEGDWEFQKAFHSETEARKYAEELSSNYSKVRVTYRRNADE